MRKCSKCKQEFLSTGEYFRKSCHKKGELDSWCIECRKQQYKQYHSTIKGYLRILFNINMKARCNNPNHLQYKNYGGRGIKVLFSSFNEFYKYITEQLQVDPRGLTIDRIDNNGNYEPGNIRFVTRSENSRREKYYLCRQLIDK